MTTIETDIETNVEETSTTEKKIKQFKAKRQVITTINDFVLSTITLFNEEQVNNHASEFNNATKKHYIELLTEFWKRKDVQTRMKDMIVEKKMTVRIDKNIDEPDKAMSAYMLFSKDTRNMLKSNPETASMTFKEVTSYIAEKWKNVSPADKQRYEKMAEVDKKRYVDEMKTFNPSFVDKSRRRKDTSSNKNTTIPKPKSAYGYFTGDERPVVKSEHPELDDAGLKKELRARFKKLETTDTDRLKHYFDIVKEKTQEYEASLEEHNNGEGVVEEHKDEPEAEVNVIVFEEPIPPPITKKLSKKGQQPLQPPPAPVSSPSINKRKLNSVGGKTIAKPAIKKKKIAQVEDEVDNEITA